MPRPKKTEEEEEHVETSASVSEAAGVDKAVHKSAIVVDNGESRITTTLADGTVITSIL